MTHKSDKSRLAAFSVGYSTRPEFQLRSNSSSPLKWTEILVESVFSPLPFGNGFAEQRTFAMSQGFKPLAGEWVGAR
jgi:hypothetical protein